MLLRLIVSYRRQFLDALLRQGGTEAEQVRREYHEAQSRSEREYEETAAAMAAKKALTGEEEAELWRDARCRVPAQKGHDGACPSNSTALRTGRTVAALYERRWLFVRRS